MAGRKTPPASPTLAGLDYEWKPDGNNEWYTPPSIFEALGVRFDLDPCSPPRGTGIVPADRFLSIEDDGLSTPWHGRVWLNPPYGSPAPWVEKLAFHGDGIALLPVDTSTDVWHKHVVTADAMCFLKGRLKFIKATRREGGGWTARFPVGLFGWGPECAEAVLSCGLGWMVDQRL